MKGGVFKNVWTYFQTHHSSLACILIDTLQVLAPGPMRLLSRDASRYSSMIIIMNIYWGLFMDQVHAKHFSNMLFQTCCFSYDPLIKHFFSHMTLCGGVMTSPNLPGEKIS